MTEFHDRLKKFIKASDYDYKSLSLEIGQGERYISNLLSSNSDPGYSSVVKICAALGLTPNQMAGLDDRISLSRGDVDQQIVTAQADSILASVTREARRKLAQRGTRPMLDDVLSWWHQQGGLLSNFDALSRHVDLYRAPANSDTLPDPYMVGDQSLAATSFGITSPEQFRQLYATFDRNLSNRVTLAHVETANGNPNLSIQELDVTLPGHNFPLRFIYKRLLLPVRDAFDNEFVLNFSQAIE